MGKSLSSIVDEMRDLIDDLDRIDLTGDSLADDGEVRGVIECLELGLPLIVEKYGHSSSEAEAVRQLIEKWK